MFLRGIKNYFINLKYFFTPLGVIFLAIVIGLSVFIPGVIDSIKTLADGVSKLTSEVSVDFSALVDEIEGAIGALSWDDPIGSLATIFDSEWLSNTILAGINTLVGDSGELAAQIIELVEVSVASIIGAAVVAIVFFVLGIVAGYFLTKILVRRSMARRTFFKYLLMSFIDALIALALIMFSMWMSSLWKGGIFVSAVLSVLIFGLISLSEAYIAHGWRKVEYRAVVNLKNIALLLLTDIAILVISGCIIAAVGAIVNTITELLVALALIQIAFLVIGLNAEAYVKGLADAAEARRSEQADAQK